MHFAENNKSDFDSVVLLQPTSPFRTSENIREAIDLFDASLDMVVSVKEPDSNPYYTMFEEDENGYLGKSKEGNYSRRQDCPKVYEYNGAIYVINSDRLKQMPIAAFKKVKKYVMSPAVSHDIDTSLDWIVAESLLKKQSIF
jgi:N-acylneuraminate cytidylyltransferase